MTANRPIIPHLQVVIASFVTKRYSRDFRAEFYKLQSWHTFLGSARLADVKRSDQFALSYHQGVPFVGIAYQQVSYTGALRIPAGQWIFFPTGK